MLDSETADAIPTERVRYGQRVTVLAMACDPIWRIPVVIWATTSHGFSWPAFVIAGRAPRGAPLSEDPQLARAWITDGKGFGTHFTWSPTVLARLWHPRWGVAPGTYRTRALSAR